MTASVSAPGAKNSGQQIGSVQGDNVQNYFAYLATEGPEVSALGSDQVADARDLYVDPGFVLRGNTTRHRVESVAEYAIASGVIVASGGVDSGRVTAAIAIGARTGLGDVCEIRYPIGVDPRTCKLSFTASRPHVLELAEPGNVSSLCRVLAGWADELRRVGSCVVLVTDERVGDGLGHGGLTTFAVGRPDGRAVARRRLDRHLQPQDVEMWLEDERVSTFLAAAPPRSAVHAASFIVDLEEQGTYSDRQRRIEALMAALDDRGTSLANWFGRNRRLPDRAFLVAAAALEGCRASDVMQAAHDLATRLSDPEKPRFHLDGAGAARLAETSEARLTVRGGEAPVQGTVVEFTGFRRAEAVISYVLRDRSTGFADTFWGWFLQLPDQVRPRVHIAEQLGRLVLHIARERREPEIVSRLAPRWGVDPDLRPVAVRYLAEAALCGDLGRDTRAQLLAWSYEPWADQQLLSVVAEVCSGRFAGEYPVLAMNRLRGVAGQGGPVASNAAVAAIRAIWAAHPAHRVVVLDQLTRWARDPRRSRGVASDARVRVAAQALIDLVEPIHREGRHTPYAGNATAEPRPPLPPPLLDIASTSPQLHDRLVTTIAATLDRHRAGDVVVGLLLRLLNHAETHSAYREALADLLSDVVASPPTRASRLVTVGLALDEAERERRYPEVVTVVRAGRLFTPEADPLAAAHGRIHRAGAPRLSTEDGTR